MSSVVVKLLGIYEGEGRNMPYTIEDFDRDFAKEFLSRRTPEELLSSLTVEDRLRGMPAEDRLRGLPAEDRLKGLSPDEIRRLLEKLTQSGFGPDSGGQSNP